MLFLTENLSSQDFSHLKSAIDEVAIVAITDKHGVITYVNNKFCAISKYSKEELLGNTHRIVNSHYHPEEFFIDMWKTISSGKVWEGEIRNRAKDNTYYWVHTTIVPFMDENNKPQKYVSVRYEITERKLAEEQLRIYSKKLEMSNKELQDFASIAAHDLQEPLRKIQSFSLRLKSKAKEILTDEPMEYVNRIQNSAQRMQTLINDLLSYSRVTTKARPFSLVDLNETMVQVMCDLEIRLEQTRGKVKWEPFPKIEADATQMHQLFQNLIGNALKFSRPSIDPNVSISAKVINNSASKPICQITFKDNGIGFDEKYLDRIFTIFQRLHGRHEYEGSGVGLSICRKIVERHGGSITATSTPGEGASFIVSMPLEQDEKECAYEKQESSPHFGRR